MWRAAQVWPAAVIGGAVTVYIALVLGMQLPRWYVMLWPAMAAGSALLVVFMRCVRAMDCRKISYQAATIEMQIEHIRELQQLIGQLYQELP